ncbi:MAG: sigma 54-interacting transcriptional regulator [Candidatus Aminicenantes bacterium]|jgi:transcriptional regulator with PAS, ATPase and Fis domain
MLDKFFHDVFDHNFGGIMVIGDDLRIKHMNKACEEITGFSEKEAFGRFCYEVLRTKCCRDTCPINRGKSGKKGEEFICDILTKNNKRKYIKAKVIYTHGYWVDIFTDITREVELERKIRDKYIFEDIITQDKRLIEILSQFPKIAASPVPVLFEGESGAGKEVFATAIQTLSSRKDKPFVKINCASLPDTLLESELFGYKKGAFTDARKDKPGLFLVAHQGTLFLDEIGEMSLPLQAKLLRAVETGEIIPLGATKAEKVNVRFLAATNKELFKEVEQGNFREDLYYRLNVVNIKIPALRERKSDIPLFIDYFVNQFNIIQEKKVAGVSPPALEILLNHSYPGNIRELRNIMEYVFIFCNEGQIKPNHLPEYLKIAVKGRNNINKNEETETDNGEGIQVEDLSLQPFSGEKELILDALSQARWNKKKAADILQVDRTTLWRKMKKFAIS